MRRVGCFLALLGSVCGLKDPLNLKFPGRTGAATRSAQKTQQGAVPDAGKVEGDTRSDGSTVAAGGVGVVSSQDMDALVKHAVSVLTEQVLDSAEQESLHLIAAVRAKVNTRKLIFAGGCPRDYSGCPAGWAADGDLCVNAPDGEGWCGSVSAQASAAAKENFAWRCNAEWACRGASSFVEQALPSPPVPKIPSLPIKMPEEFYSDVNRAPFESVNLVFSPGAASGIV